MQTKPETTEATFKIPPRFLQDHEDRELDSPVILKRTARAVTVSTTDGALPELLDDARHYADPSDWEPELRGVCLSAAATVRAIEAARPDLAI